MEVKCGKCNSPLRSDDIFCTNCGQKIEFKGVLTCSKCKRKLPPGNNYCIQCNQYAYGLAYENIQIKTCSCGATIASGNSYCTNCGQAVNTTLNDSFSTSTNTRIDLNELIYFNMTEEQIINKIIIDELSKNDCNDKTSITALEKKKNIFTIVYGIILFICISLVFFHTKLNILAIVFFISTIIYINVIRKYNIVKYLSKEVKSRPDEKISYIVASVCSGKISNFKHKIFRYILLVLIFISTLLIFRKPYVIYEKQENEYVVRFYTLGAFKNDKELVIPSEYNGKPVVGIRGDVFAGVKTIEKVVLPNTIKEIRGGAFKNATNLKQINLPDQITEIKGNTFEGCKSLVEINIPDKVTRIGGSAFRECHELSKVKISENSNLKEIGSSAFRRCYKLSKIKLPSDVNVNSRAFKESPTIVKEYGTMDDTTSYENNTYVYIFLGESYEINKYNKNAMLQGAYISLVEVIESNGVYQFKMKYSDENEEEFFVLTKDSKYKILNDKVAFEIKSDYLFNNYRESISMTIYYN